MSDPQDPIRHLHRLVNERCRTCRDEDVDRYADLILWGKFFTPAALGPKCLDHAAQFMPIDIRSVEQWAVVDLRPIRREVNNIAHDLEPARTED